LAGRGRHVLLVREQARAAPVTLAFVARRLLAEPVGIVFAARVPGEELQHLSELEVRGLRNGDARALLGSAVQFMLDERVRERIITETRAIHWRCSSCPEA
jgi:hypothetical protein